MKLPHQKIIKELENKYKSDKNVIGIYIFGRLAKGKAIPTSDIDIEVIFKKRKKAYELVNKKIKGVPIDLSLFREDQFIKEFTKYPYLAYAALKYKILYDPKRILKKHLTQIKKYFQKNPELKKFWQEKEKKWKKAKKKGEKGTAENYFDIMEELKKKMEKSLK